LESTAGVTDPSGDVKLVDLSRQGVQLRLASPRKPGENLNIRIQCEESRLDATLRGTVRWQKTAGGERWAVGCIFEEELSYELMGELFLSGILQMDAESS
jgi:hypothetical protein